MTAGLAEAIESEISVAEDIGKQVLSAVMWPQTDLRKSVDTCAFPAVLDWLQPKKRILERQIEAEIKRLFRPQGDMQMLRTVGVVTNELELFQFAIGPPAFNKALQIQFVGFCPISGYSEVIPVISGIAQI